MKGKGERGEVERGKREEEIKGEREEERRGREKTSEGRKTNLRAIKRLKLLFFVI